MFRVLAHCVIVPDWRSNYRTYIPKREFNKEKKKKRYYGYHSRKSPGFTNRHSIKSITNLIACSPQISSRSFPSCSIDCLRASVFSPAPCLSHTSSHTPFPSQDPTPCNADRDVYDVHPRIYLRHPHTHVHYVRACYDESSGFVARRCVRRRERPGVHS